MVSFTATWQIEIVRRSIVGCAPRTKLDGGWCAERTLHPFATEAWFQMYAAVGFGPQTPWRHFLGQLDEEPVATSSLFMGVGVAGISSVAVVPSVRKQGIGSAITTAARSQAKRSGYRIGTLFSSEEAQGMYGRLGFRQYCQGGCYLWMEGD